MSNFKKNYRKVIPRDFKSKKINNIFIDKILLNKLVIKNTLKLYNSTCSKSLVFKNQTPEIQTEPNDNNLPSLMFKSNDIELSSENNDCEIKGNLLTLSRNILIKKNVTPTTLNIFEGLLNPEENPNYIPTVTIITKSPQLLTNTNTSGYAQINSSIMVGSIHCSFENTVKPNLISIEIEFGTKSFSNFISVMLTPINHETQQFFTHYPYWIEQDNVNILAGENDIRKITIKFKEHDTEDQRDNLPDTLHFNYFAIENAL